jgi:hypothetical protein
MVKDYPNIGTHRTHCCSKHGCKYGGLCAVADGVVKAEYPCEECYDDETKADKKDFIDPIMADLAQVQLMLKGHGLGLDLADVREVLERHL